MNIGGGDSLKLSGGCSGPGDGGKKAADGLVEGGEDLGGGGGGGGGGVGKCVIFEASMRVREVGKMVLQVTLLY